MEYLIFDLDRNKLWKKSKYGYTDNIDEALIVHSKEEVQSYVDEDISGKTIGISKETYLEVLNRFT